MGGLTDVSARLSCDCCDSHRHCFATLSLPVPLFNCSINFNHFAGSAFELADAPAVQQLYAGALEALAAAVTDGAAPTAANATAATAAVSETVALVNSLLEQVRGGQGCTRLLAPGQGVRSAANERGPLLPIAVQAVVTAQDSGLQEADKMVQVLARLAKICQVGPAAQPSMQAVASPAQLHPALCRNPHLTGPRTIASSLSAV